MTNDREFEELWHRHRDLVDRFLEIAERRVSIRDEYGDESWQVLPKLTLECLLKIGEREHELPQTVNKWMQRYVVEISDGRFLGYVVKEARAQLFRRIREELEAEFRRHHAGAAHRTAQNPDHLSGIEFEVFVGRALTVAGFENVRGTPATGDQGADLLATKDGRLVVIQAKRQASSVGNGAVQEVVAAVHFYGADEGWVVTTSSFTPAAKALAQKAGIHLVDGTSLKTMLTANPPIGRTSREGAAGNSEHALPKSVTKRLK